MLLLSIILIPVVGLFLVSTAKTYSNNANINIVNSDNNIKKIALITSIITFAVSLLLPIFFDPNTPEYQFTYSFGNNLPFTSNYQIGVDGISL